MVKKDTGWRLNRQVNISVLVQLLFLASLIVGSWVNLQRQLDLLQHDVTALIDSNKQFKLTLPRQLLLALRWGKGDEIAVELDDGNLILRRVKEK